MSICAVPLKGKLTVFTWFANIKDQDLKEAVNLLLKGGVHGSAHVHESKYFFAFARYDPSLFNLIRCFWTIQKEIL